MKAGTDSYILSNNHVMANSNKASIGDNILQPGPVDGGSNPTDRIATLANFVEIKFDGSDNVVDAAIARIDLPTGNYVLSATGDEGYGQPSARTRVAAVGMGVTKYGRTTGKTIGTVDAINMTVDICYKTRGPFRCKDLARFVNQIVIIDGSFSAGGDSGSGIVTNDGKNNPVALLFAGSSSHTIANPIDAVLSALGVTIDDGSGGGDPGNDPPTADDVTASGEEDQVQPILWSPLVDDPNNDVLECSITSQPTNGSALVDSGCAGGSYTPAADFNGLDPFTYAVSDGSASDQGTVTVSVTAINDAPETSDDSYNTTIGTTLNVSIPGVLENDNDVEGDVLTTSIVTGPSNALNFEFNADGSFSYTSDMPGGDSFTYTASDGALSSNLATVTITVSAAADDMHVGNLTQSSINQGSTWEAVVTITILDTNRGPVSNATVGGTWSDAGSGNEACVTVGNGQCEVRMTGIRKRNSSVTYTVENVQHSSLTYDANANTDTSITVLKP